MHVLWVTSNLPDPRLGGGPAHEYELLRWAAIRHDVTLLAGGLVPTQPVPRSLVELDLRAVVGFGRPRSPVPRKSVILYRSLVGATPFEFWMARDRISALLHGARGRTGDLVQVVWAESAPVARDAVRRAPTAFFAADAFSRHEERELAAATTVRQRMYHRLQLRQTLRWEQTYREAGAVAVASAIDADALLKDGISTSVVPSALGDEWFLPAERPRDATLVSFIAALDYGPNQDAARWLLTEIWPRIRAGVPESHLQIVGRHPDDTLRRAVERAGGELVADVPDIRPHYWGTGVALIPVRLGAGMRNKVLHAVACGAPVVATSTALEGIPLEPGAQVLQADDACGLADATCALLRDRIRAGAMAERARPIADAARTASVGSSLDALWERARSEWRA